MRVRVFPDLEAMSHETAALFVNLSRKYREWKGRFAVAVSGGSTPKRLYELLSSDQYRKNVDWNKIHFFWVDERCVAKEDEESNFRLAFDSLLSKVVIPVDNIHRIKGEYGPEKGAKEYEDDIKRFFGKSEMPVFDLIMLGMGEDGHTASLFPGSKSLGEKKRFAIPVYTEAKKINRITLTLSVLNNADNILFLVSGQSKARVLADILEDEEKRKQYPAGLINPAKGNIMWLIDKEAANKLKRVPVL